MVIASTARTYVLLASRVRVRDVNLSFTREISRISSDANVPRVFRAREGIHHASVAARNAALNLALILDLRAGARVFSTAMD